MASQETQRGGAFASAWRWFDARVPFRYLLGTTLVGTFLLMFVGSYTKSIGAGSACPDWPTCYGVWFPFLHPEVIESSSYAGIQIFAEWAHRGIAMVVGILILLSAVMGWFKHRHNRWILGSLALALVLLPVQAILGALTVWGYGAIPMSFYDHGLLVAVHLGTATLIIIGLTVATTVTWYDTSVS